MITNWAKLHGSKESNSSYLLIPEPGVVLCGKASLFNIPAFHARVYDFHRIIERLEKTFSIIESGRKPNTTKSTTNPCP